MAARGDDISMVTGERSAFAGGGLGEKQRAGRVVSVTESSNVSWVQRPNEGVCMQWINRLGGQRGDGQCRATGGGSRVM